MPWFRIDDGFHGHPKVVELSLGAVGLWTLSGSWCANYLTDGFVPTKTIMRLGGTESLVAELTSVGLWDASEEGCTFNDWAEYQPLKEAVKAERAAAQARMQAVRANKKGVRANESRTDAEQTPKFGRSSEEVRIAPSLPIPSQSQPLATEADFDRAYSHWPKKTERSKSFTKFRQVAKDRGIDTVVQDVIRFGDAYAKHVEKQFVPALAVWLNGERWTDEIPDAAQTKQDPSTYYRRPDAPTGKRYAVDVIEGLR